MAVLGLCCCPQSFSSWGVWASHCGGFSSCRARGLEHAGLAIAGHRLSSYGTQASLLFDMWNLPGAAIGSRSPPLAGRFLTTGPPGKSQTRYFKHLLHFLTLVLFTNVPGNSCSQHQSANRQLSSRSLGQNFWCGNLSRVGISFLFQTVQNVCVVLNACGSNGKAFYPIMRSLYCCWPHLAGEKLGNDILDCGSVWTQPNSDRISIWIPRAWLYILLTKISVEIIGES